MPPTPSIAYGQLMRSLHPLEGSKLHPHESAVLRDAADARLFGDLDADSRLDDVQELLERLVDVDRLQPELAELLFDQVARVGDHRGLAPAA